MKPAFHRILGIFLLMSLTSLRAASASEPRTLTMDHAPLQDLLRTATKVRKKSYSADPKHCEKFTIVTPPDLTPSEAQITLESALLAHAFTLKNQGNSYTVRSIRSGGAEADCQPALNKVVTRLFRLRKLSTTEAMRMLSPVMSKEVLMDEVPDQNSIVLSDERSHIERAAQLLKSRDPRAAF